MKALPRELRRDSIQNKKETNQVLVQYQTIPNLEATADHTSLLESKKEGCGSREPWGQEEQAWSKNGVEACLDPRNLVPRFSGLRSFPPLPQACMSWPPIRSCPAVPGIALHANKASLAVCLRPIVYVHNNSPYSPTMV